MKIHNKENTVVTLKLRDILSCIDNYEAYNWKALWLTGTGKDVLTLEDSINHSKDGYPTSVSDLLNIKNSLSQIVEILIVGDKDVANLKRYADDADLRKSCRYCVELVDSSYWEINSKDSKFRNEIASRHGATSIIGD